MEPIFAVCELVTATGLVPTSGSTITGTAEIVQIPGKPATVKWNLLTGLMEDDMVYPRINTTGRLYTASTTDALTGYACSGITEEFNPLTERDAYGRPNPYQDFSRGRLDALTIDSNAEVVDGVQNYLLQNLSGKDSIIGHSISLYLAELKDIDELPGDTFTSIEACCTIALDETPYRWLPTPHYHSQ